MSKDADYLKYVNKLMATKGAVRSSGHKPFNHYRSRAEIIAIVKKCETLTYGKQDDYLESIGASRSNLHYWRKKVRAWMNSK